MIHQALINLSPGTEWTISGEATYENIQWLNIVGVKPTKEEIENEIIRLQNSYANNQYQRSRASDYPSIGDQLDMLWHAIDTGTLDKSSSFYTTIKQVKDTFPKE